MCSVFRAPQVKTRGYEYSEYSGVRRSTVERVSYRALVGGQESRLPLLGPFCPRAADDLVVDAVVQPRDGDKDRRPQGLQVVDDLEGVSLVEADGGA